MAAKFKACKRTDYKAPDFTAASVELTFELDDEKTKVLSLTRYRRLTQDRRAPLVLAGEELALKSVLLDGDSCKYREEKGRLIVEDVPDEFELAVENEIDPAGNTELMGLYKSDGVFCTQCEPEGFRRITYFLDRPDVLARYKVTIIGPEYGCGVLLSNGNLTEKGSRKGRQYAVWEDPFPKPSYLFALVAGTFDIVSDSFVTKSGRRVSLSLYVDRGSHDRGVWAMQSLKRAMKWDEERFGLEYDLDNFKVVAVDFFNQGAMENKSLNIFNSVFVMVDPQTACDRDFYDVESVIGHEYFHNYTGDRVTLRDWFQLSLKESLTVFRDQEFSSDVSSRTLARLAAVNVIRGPQFAEDASPVAHPVRPEEVMEMNNFYTVTIYDKGAEIIRMIHTLTGEEQFKAGLQLYLRSHDGQAVTIEDFVKCMEQASGRDLTGQFFRWYTQYGTPEVTVRREYSAGRLTLHFSQKIPVSAKQPDPQPLLIPVRASFIAKDGSAVKAPELPENGVLEFTRAQQDFEFSVPEGTLPVLFEDFSAPVKLDADYSDEDYTLMLGNSGDPFIKADSCRMLQDHYIRSEIGRKDEDRADPKALIEALGKVIAASGKTDLNLVAQCLTVAPLTQMMQSFDTVDLDALCAARAALEERLALALEPQFGALLDKVKPASPRYSVADMGRRAVASQALYMKCLALRSRGKADEAAALSRSSFRQAGCMTETVAALRAAVHLDLGCKDELLKQFDERWHSNPLVMDTFFRIQASAPSEETVFTVRRLLKHPAFSLGNPNRVRALLGTLTRANPVALHRKDGAGYTLIIGAVRQLNDTNTQLAASLITPFLSFRRFDAERQQLMRAQLEKLYKLPNLARSVYEKIEAALKQE